MLSLESPYVAEQGSISVKSNYEVNHRISRANQVGWVSVRRGLFHRRRKICDQNYGPV